MKAHAMFILICILLLNACTKMPVGTGDGASEQADIEKTIHYDNYSINGEYPVELQDEVKEIELSATATAPVVEPTPTAEATPTQSAEQIEQSIMDQFVSGPLYDQYIADNQIPEQAATAFYEEYKGADGEPFSVVTMKVDPNSLSEEQKALNIPQRDYLVVKTADGQIEFKLLPANLQLETFSQSAVEFTLTKEYQKGLQDYLNAMGLREEDVTITEEVKVINGQEHRFLVTSKNTVLAIGIDKEWKVANPGLYWGIFGKFIGAHMNGDEWKTNKKSAIEAFSNGGIVSLSGQVRPGPNIMEREPARAATYLYAAKTNNMSLVFSYVVEPGKFPTSTNTGNIDIWLHTRLSETADVVVYNKPEKPVLIQFNEPFNGPRWNPEHNPIKDKYGENWLGEYIFQNLSIFIDKGLFPNKDFFPFLNENLMLDTNMQEYVHTKVVAARQYTFDKLMADQAMARKLQAMNILKAEDIIILFGSQTYVNLDGQYRQKIVFQNDPTINELNTLADKFADLGGIVLTEVGPFGNLQQQVDFLRKLSSAVLNNPNLRGMILWNAFDNPEDYEGDIYATSSSLIIDKDGNPTSLFFELMSWSQ